MNKEKCFSESDLYILLFPNQHFPEEPDREGRGRAMANDD